MKIAVTYNTPAGVKFAQRGRPCHEWLPQHQIDTTTAALRRAGHEVQGIEADIHLVEQLMDFFDSEKDTEFPGLVFNLAYGIQGKMRYCHVPSVLEMLGLPYLGSDPLSHALAFDKLTAKRLFRSLHLATPEFDVYEDSETGRTETSNGRLLVPDSRHRVVVKPVAEAVSEGLELVSNKRHLRHAVEQDLEEFGGPILAEEYIAGREINVSLMGNDPVDTLPPVEVVVEGSPLFDELTKKGKGAKFHLVCPVSISDEVRRQARDLAVRAFAVLRCRDWARVDMRLDEQDQLHILEVNTIPGFGGRSSFFTAARAAGMQDHNEFISHLVDIAVKRYEQT